MNTYELEAFRLSDRVNAYATLIGGIQSLVRDARSGVPAAISEAIALFEATEADPETARKIVQKMIRSAT